ncbi:MAG: ribonuclease J [Patescibacteria group bacterium]
MLRFIALSGTTGVTENLYIYEQDGEMMIVDCGIGFPDLEMPGVDLVLPDYSYVVKNRHKLKGIVVSQGHEDHIGALPFLLRDIKTTIWAPPLVTEFIKDKFKDYGVRDYKINTFNPDNDQFQIGSFKIQPFRVTHSIPDTVGFAIDTSEGRIFHVPEHKMDQNPVDGKSLNIGRARDLAKSGVLFLASDCLGSNKPGFVESELPIEDKMLEIVRNAKKAVLVTAISSNIGRFQQIINVAKKVNRKVIFVGRSIQKKAEMAHNLDYLKYSSDQVISYKDLVNLRSSQVLYIVSGCFGQVGSSVYRISQGDHDKVKVNEGDTFIFSADPAPAYSKESEDFVIDGLIDKGVDVHYYDLKEGLYVSGHGGQEDIKKLFEIVKPKYFIPIGGTIRFMDSYGKLVNSTGINSSNVFKLKAGESTVFDKGNVSRGETVPTKNVLVHGLGIGDIGKVVLGDRAILGNEGIVVVVVKVGKDGRYLGGTEIISKGFVFEGTDRKILENAILDLTKVLNGKRGLNAKSLREESIKFLEKHFFKVTGRSPMILPVILEI